MANPILPLNGTHQLQERFTQTIVPLKRKQHIVRNFFNTDFVGDPRSGAVKFTRRDTEVTVANYDVVAGVNLTTSTTSYTQVLVDQNIAINELIDGYEAAAVPDNVVAQRLDSAAFSLGRSQELFAIGVLESGATDESTTTETAANDVYGGIVISIKNIRKLGVPVESLVVVISDDTHAKLLTDVKYSNTASTIGAELVREGIVSKIAGVPVVVSSNLDDGGVSDEVTEWVVFSTLYAAKAEEWNVPPTINDLRDGAHIGASALQGRIVYKDVLLDSTTCRRKFIDISA